MIAGLGRRPWALGWSAVFALASATATVATAGDEQVRAWIGDLDADSFETRELATQRLLSGGGEATLLLKQALSNGTAETQWRAAAILGQLESAHRAKTPLPAAASAASADEPCSDQAAALVTGPPASPEPPPEADIAQALVPPPPPVPLEAITEQVLIADAYVAPELSAERANGAAAATAAPRATAAKTAIVNTPSQPARSSSPVVFVRPGFSRGPAGYNRDNQPRLLNVFQRARLFFGLSAR